MNEFVGERREKVSFCQIGHGELQRSQNNQTQKLGQTPVFNRLSKRFQIRTPPAPPTRDRRVVAHKLSGKPEMPGQTPRMRASAQLGLPPLGSSSEKAETRRPGPGQPHAPGAAHASWGGRLAGRRGERTDFFPGSAPLLPPPATSWA